MDERRRNELARACAPALERIEEWRRTRSRRNEPMPGRLWAQATRLARAYGVYPVARALGLNRDNLKRRMEESERPGECPQGSKPLFVELGLPAQARDPGVVLELVGRDGAKLTARLPEHYGLDLRSLAEAFWRRGR